MRLSWFLAVLVAHAQMVQAQPKPDIRLVEAQRALASYEQTPVAKQQPEMLKKHLAVVKKVLAGARQPEKKVEAGLLLARLAFRAKEPAAQNKGVQVALATIRQFPEPRQIEILRKEISEAASRRRYALGLSGFIPLLKELTDDDSVERFADYHQAIFLLAGGEKGEVRRLFRELSAEGSRDVWAERASYQLGMMESDLRNYGRASRQFQNFLSQFPQSRLVPAAQHALAMNYYSQGYKFMALSYCQDLLQKYPKSEFAGASRLFIEKIKIEILQGIDPF